MSNSNGTQTTWNYSPERGFLQAMYTSGPTTIQDLTYTRDPVGLLDQVSSAFPNESWSYTYDDLYRMTQATNLTSPTDSQTFTYDELGRIVSNSRAGSYTYPPVGEPRPHAPSTVNGAPYSYDANGNLTSGGGRNPIWDAENRVSQIGTTQFTYDADGDRLKKTGAGGTSLYPLGEEYEVTNGTITKYVSVEGMGVVAKRVGSATYWIHADHLGSIQAITDSVGSVVYRRTYRPYGETITQGGSLAESRGWVGQRQDTETGLMYLHARYYDPATGIFLSPDPAAADPNTYRYGFGNPVNLSDQHGRMANCLTLFNWLYTQMAPVTNEPSNSTVPHFTDDTTVTAKGGSGAIECSYFDNGPLTADARLAIEYNNGLDPIGHPVVCQPGSGCFTPPILPPDTDTSGTTAPAITPTAATPPATSPPTTTPQTAAPLMTPPGTCSTIDARIEENTQLLEEKTIEPVVAAAEVSVETLKAGAGLPAAVTEYGGGEAAVLAATAEVVGGGFLGVLTGGTFSWISVRIEASVHVMTCGR